ncbi:heavy-metal-associated domain-containing protein [Saliphagus infecundisoli]|uniref:Heavy-metal-associated domain-containing protein n=1 Tax=Saliphagus infecundisoli TaxID=1849069 RepID=A0ABD5QI17_9EURY|nr:heavy-metal-associated domain-containing protein [Saliphagus infecundisoli]
MSETIRVEDMICEHCEQTVEESPEDVDGVMSASADQEVESITAEGSADTDTLVSIVNDTGCDATG